VLEFDNSQKTVTKAGKLPGNKTGELGLTAMTKNPAVNPVGSKQDEKGCSPEEDTQADGRWSVPNPIEAENDEVGKEQAEEPSQEGLGDLDPPETGTKGADLLLQAFRERSTLFLGLRRLVRWHELAGSVGDAPCF